MAHRSASHAKLEKTVFDAFLAVERSLGALVTDVDQPDDVFPDITVKLSDGTLIDFELAEWLDRDQIAGTKRRGELEGAILTAISAPMENLSRHFRAVVLTPRPDAPVFRSGESDVFNASLLNSYAKWKCVGRRSARGTRPRDTFVETLPPILPSIGISNRSSSIRGLFAAANKSGQPASRTSSSGIRWLRTLQRPL